MMYTRVLQEGRRRECQMEYVARKASTMRGALLALALLSAGCGHAVKSGPPEPQAPTTLKVRNQNFLDTDVFVLREGQRIRLGMVAGLSSQAFTIPADIVRRSPQLRSAPPGTCLRMPSRYRGRQPISEIRT